METVGNNVMMFRLGFVVLEKNVFCWEMGRHRERDRDRDRQRGRRKQRQTKMLSKMLKTKEKHRVLNTTQQHHQHNQVNQNPNTNIDRHQQAIINLHLNDKIIIS